MKFYSLDFDDYQPMDVRFTGEGGDEMPRFAVEDVPGGTKSLALIVHDPDSPGGKEWTHCLVWDISSTIDGFGGEKELIGTYGINDFGNTNYGGPMPSPGSGPHRYVFSLFALDKKLDLPEKTNRDQLTRAMLGHILSQSMWVGTYERN